MDHECEMLAYPIGSIQDMEQEREENKKDTKDRDEGCALQQAHARESGNMPQNPTTDLPHPVSANHHSDPLFSQEFLFTPPSSQG